MRLMATLRRIARLRAAVRSRTRLSSSRKVTSRTQWSPFSMVQCRRIAWIRTLGSSQGRRMKLSSQQGQHVRIIPGGLLATRPHADLGCSAVTDEVDGDLAQDRQVARCRPIPNAAVIFSEGDIQDPMEPIFYGPMPADCLDQDLGVIAAA